MLPNITLPNEKSILTKFELIRPGTLKNRGSHVKHARLVIEDCFNHMRRVDIHTS
jgi:hypothetical protein